MNFTKRKFTDQMGRTIELSAVPKRIISLVPSQTELLFYLGLKEEIVGITKFCIHPVTQINNLCHTKIGGTKKINFEKIKYLNPDLIIANKEENEERQIRELMKNYTVWMSDIKTLKDSYDMILKVGEIVNKSMEAEELNLKIQKQFSNFNYQLSIINYQFRSVAYFIWRNPYMVAGSDTFINHLLELCGFKNVFAKTKNRYPEITINELKRVHPELILLSSEPYPFKEKHIKEFQDILPSAKIKIVDGELFSWYGSRLLHSPAYFSELIKSIK